MPQEALENTDFTKGMRSAPRSLHWVIWETQWHISSICWRNAALKPAFKRDDGILEWQRPGNGAYQQSQYEHNYYNRQQGWNGNQSILAYKNRADG